MSHAQKELHHTFEPSGVDAEAHSNSSGSIGMAELFDYKAFSDTPLQSDPFEFSIIDRFVKPAVFPALTADFPKCTGPGSHPIGILPLGDSFGRLIDELNSTRFRAAVEDKFGIDLTGLATACTVRGETAAKEGRIHTDSESKVITVLIYMNEAWQSEGGRLRLLRSGTDLEDYVAEVPPTEGTMLIFRRSDRSWHGHKPFAGQRKVIQFNWVTGQQTVFREKARHSISHFFKRLGLNFDAFDRLIRRS